MFLLKNIFNRSNSGKCAKKRLLAVVSRDRANVSADFLLSLSNELISAALKYIEADLDNISIFIQRNNSDNCLMAKIPIVAYRKTL